MATAFQPSAFQNNAFQIDVTAPADCITWGAINFECITMFLIGSGLLSWII